MKPLAFATRSLPANDPVRLLLESHGYRATGHSMLTFTEVLPQQPIATSWVFAYSRNGVRYLIEPLVQQILAQNIRVGAIGPATAEAWQQRGVPVDFVGSSNPLATASAFAKTLHASPQEATITYLQAQHSRQSIQHLLGEQFEQHKLITYTNQAAAGIDVPPADLYFLTSPMNAQLVLAQLQNRQQHYKLACIGPTTAEAVYQLGFGESLTALD